MRRETFFANTGTVSKKWRIVDAEGQSLGRLAAEIAVVLMGKHRPDYTPHVDCGDYVIVLNASKVGLSGRKAEQRMAQNYSEYPGGLKETSYGQLRQNKPGELLELAVRRMLPKNRLGRVMLGNMRVYAGADHPHAAHKPIAL